MAGSSRDRRIGRIINDKSSTTILWKIYDFVSLPMTRGTLHYSPSFSFMDARWYLEITPNGDNRKDTVGWIGLYLKKQSPRTKMHHVNFTLGMHSSTGTIYNSYSATCPFEGSERGFGNPHVIRRSEFEDKAHIIITPDNILTVFCVINDKDHVWDQIVEDLTGDDEYGESTGASSMDADKLYEPKRTAPNPTGVNPFWQNLEDLLFSGRLSDFKIRINGEVFPVHKTILAAHSPVFLAMFENEMEEKNSCVVTIPDSKPDDFREFLHYLYTGKVEEVSLMHVCGVYMLADKYDVKQLKGDCVAIMNRGLSVDIFCDIIFLAVKYSESELLKTATAYFVKNAKSILQTVRWQSFIAEAPTVANELFLKTMS